MRGGGLQRAVHRDLIPPPQARVACRAQPSPGQSEKAAVRWARSSRRPGAGDGWTSQGAGAGWMVLCMRAGQQRGGSVGAATSAGSPGRTKGTCWARRRDTGATAGVSPGRASGRNRFVAARRAAFRARRGQPGRGAAVNGARRAEARGAHGRARRGGGRHGAECRCYLCSACVGFRRSIQRRQRRCGSVVCTVATGKRRASGQNRARRGRRGGVLPMCARKGGGLRRMCVLSWSGRTHPVIRLLSCRLSENIKRKRRYLRRGSGIVANMGLNWERDKKTPSIRH